MEYRLYTFINFYLSQIQQGIQSAHIVSELFTKYENNALMTGIIKTWARSHKTIIVCNGGNSAGISEFSDVFQDSPYPYADFYEDMDSLGGVRTGIGIILPEAIFKCEKRVDGLFTHYEYQRSGDEVADTIFKSYNPTHPAFALIHAVKSAKLA